METYSGVFMELELHEHEFHANFFFFLGNGHIAKYFEI